MEKKLKNSRNFLFGRRAIFIVFLLLLVPLIATACNAADYEDYAPILYFEGEETCYPVDINYHIDNSELKSAEIQGEIVPYYDNTHGTTSNDGVINHYQSQLKNNFNGAYGSKNYKVYYRIDDSVEGSTLIQYWMFYAFNKGELNSHEGDWEMVQVIVPDNIIPGTSFRRFSYSQHYSGQTARIEQIEKTGTHMKVYVSRGSHANYFRSYSGKLGLASDIVGDNGKILEPDDYILEELDDQSWLTFEGFWGEYGDESDLILGGAGPQGPMFRHDLEGNLYWDGDVAYQAVNEMFLMIELFLYHFVTIFIILTVVILLIIFFRIYRRNKKHGLGPRKLSMLYIDGINLHTIGNILCFVGIILAIISLTMPWYSLSGDVSVTGFDTGGKVDMLTLYPMEGFQIFVPGFGGPAPLGSMVFPFGLLIAISIIFLFLSTIGINQSRKLGYKYIGRGIRLIIPIIILIAGLFLAASQIPGSQGSGGATDYLSDVMGSITSSPFGGEKIISETGTSLGDININMQWGLGIGAYLLLFSGIILLIAGILSVVKNKVFFEPKTPIQKPKKEKIKKEKKSQTEKPLPPKKEKESKSNFCGKCGTEVAEGEKFCSKCGEKI